MDHYIECCGFKRLDGTWFITPTALAYEFPLDEPFFMPELSGTFKFLTFTPNNRILFEQISESVFS